ncbi:hypothetical protein BDZ89DRAFT_1032329 [Hymenopellis radicata]|nr:hypothetical protein BDZ89DRAFT_1032329 [Hymenopellis radicata]
MVFIRCRTFLGCLPLASGVWLLSLVGAMMGISAAVGSWMEVNFLETHPNPLLDTIALFVQAIVFSLLGFFSVIGFVMGVLKNRHIAFIYPKILAVHYVAMLGALAYTLFYTFRPVSALTVASCAAGSLDDVIDQFCTKGLSLIKLLPLIWYIVVLTLIQPYAFVLADNLAEKLEIDDIARVPKDFILNSDAASFYSKDALSFGSKDLERGRSAKWYPGGRRAP